MKKELSEDIDKTLGTVVRLMNDLKEAKARAAEYIADLKEAEKELAEEKVAKIIVAKKDFQITLNGILAVNQAERFELDDLKKNVKQIKKFVSKLM